MEAVIKKRLRNNKCLRVHAKVASEMAQNNLMFSATELATECVLIGDYAQELDRLITELIEDDK